MIDVAVKQQLCVFAYSSRSPIASDITPSSPPKVTDQHFSILVNLALPHWEVETCTADQHYIAKLETLQQLDFLQCRSRNKCPCCTRSVSFSASPPWPPFALEESLEPSPEPSCPPGADENHLSGPERRSWRRTVPGRHPHAVQNVARGGLARLHARKRNKLHPDRALLGRPVLLLHHLQKAAVPRPGWNDPGSNNGRGRAVVLQLQIQHGRSATSDGRRFGGYHFCVCNLPPGHCANASVDPDR